jgi:Encapsulating protein for peroxidase
MDQDSAHLGWSDEQWARVGRTVQEEAQKARIAAQFLPTVVTADKTAVAVPDNSLTANLLAPQDPTRRLVVDHTPATFLTSISVNVALTSQEVADPDQAGALIQFRRAANLIARVEDALMFCGQPAAGVPPVGIAGLPPVVNVRGGGNQPGLAVPPPLGPLRYLPRQDLPLTPGIGGPGGPGNDLATQIIAGVGLLEAAGHNRPFACVLPQDLFTDLHVPTPSLVMPRDRVVPFLDGGPLLRSSTLPLGQGVLVALGGSPIEIVVSRELHVRYLQTTLEPRHIVRVSERVALRVVEWSSIVVLHR